MTPETLQRINEAAERTVAILKEVSAEADNAAASLERLADAQAKVNRPPGDSDMERDMEVIRSIFGQAFRNAHKRKQ